MYDILPFPNITGATPEEQLGQINSYLIQFKETLEFALASISTDNLASDLIDKLNALGANIEKSDEERNDQIQQITRKTLSVSDVINSQMFIKALQGVKDDIPKEYLVSAKQIETSDEPGGINIYGITGADGQETQLTVRNGKTPELKINYETGELEYT